ncbi:MAG: glutamine--tRNA ligase/YqeY domain fusion protein [Christensenellales bacterium]|jgi:glutaminyl-tRNA synthetase
MADFTTNEGERLNFIEEIVAEYVKNGGGPVVTRFPPEPNGYLHIGHAKALCIDFGIAEKFGGKCNLRYDDTNPAKEDEEFVDAIEYDIKWLGFEYAEKRFGSDYFETCYELAEKLIKKGVAYVCDLSREELREYRGTLTEPGKNSPYRDRSVEENLDLFRRMRAGEFPDGSRTLRAKIDMASPNINLRDPALYRILHMPHHQTGDKWCIYPMYDFAHPIQDALEGVTHSLCSLEYEIHRPLYDWVIEQCEFEHRPRQIEFARLNLARTVMSKRYLRSLVESGTVSGWDDPRMPTLCGMRRRGYTPNAIKDFLKRTGVAKADSVSDPALLEHCLREDLNPIAHRMCAVIDPVKVTLTNWPEDKVEKLVFENLPGNEAAGTREVLFGRTLYIEREDFMEDPPKKFFRLRPGGEVRLKNAYIIKCESVVKDEQGDVVELLCTFDPDSKSGQNQRKVKGTLHFVSEAEAVLAEFRLYDYLLLPDDDPKTKDLDYTERTNPNSLIVKRGFIERALKDVEVGEPFQFLRLGYFCKDPDSTPELPVFNRSVGLKDSYRG